MTEVDRLVAASAAHARARADLADPRPSRKLAIVTCMDARIDVFAALGLRLGEAHIIRNAGARVTEDVLRSLALSTQVLGVDTVVVMQHTECGLAGVDDRELRERTGADLDFLPIPDHTSTLQADIEHIVGAPYLSSVETAAGLLYDIEAGKAHVVVRWERATAPHSSP